MFNGLFKFLGGITFGFGIFLLVLLLLFSSVQEQFDNSENIVNESFDNFIAQNQEELIDLIFLDQIDIPDNAVQLCKQGLIQENCDLVVALEENKTAVFETEFFLKQKSLMVEQLGEQIDYLLKPLSLLDSYKKSVISLAFILLIVGGVLLYLGVERKWNKFISRILMGVFWQFLSFGLLLYYFALMSIDNAIDGLNIGISAIFAKLALNIILGFFIPVAEMYYLSFLVIAGVSLAGVLGLFFFGKSKEKVK